MHKTKTEANIKAACLKQNHRSQCGDGFCYLAGYLSYPDKVGLNKSEVSPNTNPLSAACQIRVSGKYIGEKLWCKL